MATSNMNLDLPTVSTTLGPAWASMINAALTLIDAHDHTSGNGVPVPTAGLDIDADLAFGGNNATLLRSTRFSAQSAVLAVATDLRCLYAVGGDLYYNNASGTPVQITDGGSLSATSLGGITGLPSGTASVAFATSTYTFNSATNTRATMDVGPVVIRDTAAAALGITIASPTGLAGAYTLTLPSALPGSTKFLRLSSAGAIAADVAPDGTSLEVSSNLLQVKAGGVTRTMQAAVGQQVSSAASSSTSATSPTNLTSLTVSLTTTGRPVMIGVISDDVAPSSGWWGVGSTVAGYHIATVFISVTGSATASIGYRDFAAQMALSAGTWTVYWPASSFWHFYAPSAGTYTFQLKGSVDAATTTLAWNGVKLVAWEL